MKALAKKKIGGKKIIVDWPEPIIITTTMLTSRPQVKCGVRPTHRELFIKDLGDVLSQAGVSKLLEQCGQEPMAVGRGVPVEAAVEDWVVEFRFLCKNFGTYL